MTTCHICSALNKVSLVFLDGLVLFENAATPKRFPIHKMNFQMRYCRKSCQGHQNCYMSNKILSSVNTWLSKDKVPFIVVLPK